MSRNFSIYRPHVSIQNQYQALAERLAKAKSLVTRGTAEVERVKSEFYEKADAMFGEGAYVIFEAREPHAHMRMMRVMQEPRSYDIDGMRGAFPPDIFTSITKTAIDTDALDNAIARRMIKKGDIEPFIHYGQRPNLIWEPTGARSEIQMMAGNIAVVAPQHAQVVPAVAQEV